MGALLRALANAQERPWLCGGDFNLMLQANEKKEGTHLISKKRKFFERL